MQNYSPNGRPVELIANEYYYVIDSLYLTNISKAWSTLDADNIEEEIRIKVFPYMSSPFGKFLASKKFEISRFNKSEREVTPEERLSESFSSDTGLVVFIRESRFKEIASDFDYDELTDADSNDLVNKKYWESVTKRVSANEIALALAPGIGSGFEFDGGGFYEIV